MCFGDKSSTAPTCSTCGKDPKNIPLSSPISNEGRPSSGYHPSHPVRQTSVQKFQEAAQRISSGLGGPGRSDSSASLNVSAQDAQNLQVMLQRGMLTTEQYSNEMAKLRMIVAQMYEQPTHTPKSTSEITGNVTSMVQSKAFEMVYKYSYDYTLKKWDKCVLVVSIERTSFAEGNLRKSYKMKDLTKPDGENMYVAKASKDKHEDVATYFLDIEMQAMCQALAHEYNKRKPPKDIEFIDAFMIECFQRKECPLFGCEPFIEGKYVKYSNNWGFVSSHDRNTPHAFSHFTHHITGGKYIVVDVQGVGDKYTDPQMHSFDGKGFGKGNCGAEGISKFFSTHRCNVLCKMLGLTNEVRSISGTMAPGYGEGPKKRFSYHDPPSPVDLAYYGITEQDYKVLLRNFQAADQNGDGEIGLQELIALCKSLSLKINPEQCVNLLSTADSDRNGRISLQEFLQWWTGRVG